LRHGSKPLCIGQKQKWFLLQLIGDEKLIRFDRGSHPEFDHWRWVSYWYPIRNVIDFKRDVYRNALAELISGLNIKKQNHNKRRHKYKRNR
jgi:putative (di)nucleoside polyphosphate hydrolase